MVRDGELVHKETGRRTLLVQMEMSGKIDDPISMGVSVNLYKLAREERVKHASSAGP